MVVMAVELESADVGGSLEALLRRQQCQSDATCFSAEVWGWGKKRPKKELGRKEKETVVDLAL